MFNLLRKYCFDNGMAHAVFVRELIRNALETQTGVQLNQNIGEPGQPALGRSGVRGFRHSSSSVSASSASASPSVSDPLPFSNAALEKQIERYLDQPWRDGELTLTLAKAALQGVPEEQIIAIAQLLGISIDQAGVMRREYLSESNTTNPMQSVRDLLAGKQRS